MQVGLIEEGRIGDITQETRLYDEGKQITYTMRSKEGLADYRYFPEPDLPAINLTEDFLRHVKVIHIRYSSLILLHISSEGREWLLITCMRFS